eukprot:1161567-Pelagomonas_calceolata.AAC.4
MAQVVFSRACTPQSLWASTTPFPCSSTGTTRLWANKVDFFAALDAQVVFPEHANCNSCRQTDSSS